MRPLLSVVLVPSTPMKEERLSTAGSCRITLASSCWRSAIAGNEIVCGASEMPCTTPVSCVGKKPLEMTIYNQHRERKSAGRHEKRRFLMVQHPAKGPPILRYYPVELLLGPAVEPSPASPSGVCLRSLAHIIGVSVSETNAEMRMVTPRVKANSLNSRPTTSPMKSSGIRTAMSDIVRERMVNPICFEPLRAASRGGSPCSTYLCDVLDHDYGVVHDKTGGYRQRHKGEVIQRKTQEVHHAECPD